MSGFRFPNTTEPNRPPTADVSASLVAALFEHFERELAGGEVPPYVAQALARFRGLAWPEQRAQLPGVYLSFEEYLADVCAGRRHSRSHLRSIVRSRFQALLALPELAVIFAEPDEQKRRLGELFLDALRGEADRLVGERVGGSGHSSVQAAIEDIHRGVQAARGGPAAERVLDAALASLSRTYHGLGHTVLELLPVTLLDESRAHVLASMRRERAWSERLEALGRVNEELQTRVSELDRDKAELVASITTSAQSASLFGAYLGMSDEGTLAVDQRGVIVHASDASLRMWGYLEEEVVGKDVAMLLAARTGRADALRRYLETGTPSVFGERLVLEGRRRDGSTFPARVRATETRMGDRPTYALVIRDLTDSRRADAQIRLQAAALRSSASGIAIADPQGKVAWTNPSFDAMTGHAAGELMGMSLTELLADAGEAPAVPWRGERVIRRKNGTTYVARLILSPVRDETGRLVHVVIHHEDVTLERAARESLRRSEASFRALIEESPDAIFVAHGGKIIFVNGAAVSCLGYARKEDLIGRGAEEIFPPEDREETSVSIRRMEAQGMPLAPRETTLCRKDGGTIDADVVGLFVSFHGVRAAALIARDITERKRLQARLAIADRTVALATLVAGVAQEIDAPLAQVARSLEALQAALGELDEPSAEELLGQAHEAMEGADHARRIVKDLHTFARPEPLGAAHAVDPRRVLDASIDLAASHMKTRARLIKRYGNTPLVHTTETRLGQLFLYLTLHAVEAIPAGEADRHIIEIVTGTDGRGWAEIEIRDTGVGLPSDRASDRHFDAKPVGEAPEVGLSIVRGIVTALGGEMEHEAEPDRGTRVRVVLPPADRLPH